VDIREIPGSEPLYKINFRKKLPETSRQNSKRIKPNQLQFRNITINPEDQSLPGIFQITYHLFC